MLWVSEGWVVAEGSRRTGTMMSLAADSMVAAVGMTKSGTMMLAADATVAAVCRGKSGKSGQATCLDRLHAKDLQMSRLHLEGFRVGTGTTACPRQPLRLRPLRAGYPPA